MDAIATLRWVQRHIERFGGNPRNVTLFGQSAGGGMVLSLLGVPSAKGLFAKAGIQSGAALRPATPLDVAEKEGIDWATEMGLDGANATLEQLRGVAVEKFATSARTSRSLGSPVDGRFKTQATLEAFKSGTANYVPLIIGSNNGEGGFDGARAVATAMSTKAPVFLYQFAMCRSGARAPSLRVRRTRRRSSTSSIAGIRPRSAWRPPCSQSIARWPAASIPAGWHSRKPT
jgi:para-nitrobenzyl esterase